MNRPILSTHNLLGELLFALLLLPAAYLPAVLLSSRQALWLTGIECVVILLLFAVRSLAPKLWQFLLLTLLPAGIGLVLPLDIWSKVILLACMAFVIIRSLIKRLSDHPDIERISSISSLVFANALLLVVYLVAAWQKLLIFQTWLFYLAIAYLLLWLYRRHSRQLTQKLTFFENQATQPVRQIQRSNRILALAFMALLAAILVISPWLGLQETIPWLGQVLLTALGAMFRALFSLFKNEETTTSAETEPSQTQAPAGGFMTDSETPAWLALIWQILTYVLFFVVAALILLAIAYAIYSIYRKFYENRPAGKDIKVSIMPEVGQQIRQRIKRGRNRVRNRFSRLPSIRIRRCYRQMVLVLERRGIETADRSPLEVLQAAGLAEASQCMTFVSRYEKARYSNLSCTHEDATMMREAYQALIKALV